MEYIISGVIAIGTILGTYWKYQTEKKQLVDKAMQEARAIKATAEESFRDDLIARIKSLEEDGRKLTEERNAQWAQAAKERQALIADYDAKIDELRKEMRRKIDETLLELSTWRDRYYVLFAEYEEYKRRNPVKTP